MSKKIKLTVTLSAILIILVLLAIPKLSNSSESNSSMAAAQRNAALPVQAHIVKTVTLPNHVLTTGTVLANEEVDLKSEVSGKVVKIAFKEGSRVRKGDLLIKINDSELQAQLRKAESMLKLAEDKEFRQRKLLEKEAISQEDYDVAKNELKTNQAQVDLIKAQIDKTEIDAPFDGIIGLKYISEGSFVTPTTTIASLQNINPIKIDFSIPEKYASTVNKNDLVKFKIGSTNNQFTGKVYAIEPKIDPVTRTLKIRAISSNENGEILPGAFADVELVLKEIKNAILIPTQAIVPELKGQKVYLFKNGAAIPVKVETGVRTDAQVQITSGLNANDTLITTGILQVRPGAPVTISEFN